ncbi:MAG: ATP-grasp domain-containing protein [Actinomycetota bacterium]
MNVLFTSVGRRVELLRVFRRAYADLVLAGCIVAVDIDPLAPALREADHVYIVPHLTDPGYIPALVDVCGRERIGLIIPLLDPDVPVLARGRRQLEATGARLLVIPDAGVEIATDKLETYRFFQRLNIPTPRSWSPDEVRPDELEYPVFVKPRFGSGGEYAVTARNRRELAFFLGYVREPIVQEWLPGPEITSDVLCDLQGGVLAVVCRERIEVRWGEVAKGKTIYDPEIIEHCVTIAKGLNAVGPITVQCMRRDSRPFFTEINPRFGGGAPLGIAAGVPGPRWMLALAAGQEIAVPPIGTYRAGLYLTRFDDSLFLSEEDRRRVEGSRLRPR